jgi:hypothetical protein
MGLFIINFADPLLPQVGESDILYTHSHGSRTGKLLDHQTPAGTPGAGFDIVIPEVHILGSGKWNRDADFLILDACSTLNPGLNDDRTPSGRPAGFTNWLNTLRSSSRPLHGILGFEFPKTARLRSRYRSFMADMQSGVPIPVAWGDAMTDAVTNSMPWAVLWYQDNLNDRIQLLTQDPAPGDVISFIEFTGLFSTNCEDQAGATLPLAGDYIAMSGRLSLARGVVAAVPPQPLLPRALALRSISLDPESFAKRGALQKTAIRQNFVPASTHAVVPINATNEATAGAAATAFLDREFGDHLGTLQFAGVGAIRSTLITNNAPVPPPAHQTFVALYRQMLDGVAVEGSTVRVDVNGTNVSRVALKGLVTRGAAARTEALPALSAWDVLSPRLADLGNAAPPGEQWAVDTAELLWVPDPDVSPPVAATASEPTTFIPVWRFDLRKMHNGEGVGSLYFHAIEGRPLQIQP